MEKREDIVKGIQELAAFLEENPEVPITSCHAWCGTWGHGYDDETTKKNMAATAQAPGPWKKCGTESAIKLSRTFSGGVSFAVEAMRERVCKKVKVMREVEEWECDPILGGLDG